MPSTLPLLSAVNRFSLLLCSLTAVVSVASALRTTTLSSPDSPGPPRSDPGAASYSMLQSADRFSNSSSQDTLVLTRAMTSRRVRRRLNVYGVSNQNGQQLRYSKIYSVVGHTFLVADSSGSPSTTRSANSARSKFAHSVHFM